MSLPSSREQTYIPLSPPVVSASTLNLLQDWIVWLVQGLRTLRAARFQSPFGAVPAQPVPDGAAEVSRKAGSTAFATMPPCPSGQINVGNVPVGIRISAAGTLKWGVAGVSATRTAAGQYTVRLSRVQATDDTCVVQAQTLGAHRRADVVLTDRLINDELDVQIETYDTSAAVEVLADAEFMITVLGE